jgi:serine/threonine protein phosphatase PrpC
LADSEQSFRVSFRYDTAIATHQGARPYQEDSLLSHSGNHIGFCVVADGLGGHAAGDVASGIVSAEVFRQIKAQENALASGDINITTLLTDAAEEANFLVGDHAHTHDETYGMGSTLLATVIVGDALSWLSIGDSPLYLFRDGALALLNDDHSMAPHVDMLVKIGVLTEEQGRDHPSRNTLTSVVRGRKIEEIDTPDTPKTLCAGDIVIVSSDGLQYLTDARISEILNENANLPSQKIADILIAALVELDDPEQDNIAFAVIKIGAAED